MEVHLDLKLFVPCKESAPVGLEVFVLHVFLLALAGVDVEDVPDLVDLVLLLGLVVVVVGEGVDGRRKGVWVGLGLGGLSCCVLLAFALVPQLVVDVGIKSSDFVVIYEDGDLALPVS